MKKIRITCISIVIILLATFCLTGCSLLQGKSAYDLAVEQGFTGTLDQWLSSLKGEQGEQGEKGSVDVGIESISITQTGALQVLLQDGTVVTLGKVVGKDGVDGVSGIDGQSAYALAVSKGFSGTQEQWLDSLKGEKGSVDVGIASIVIDGEGQLVVTLENSERIELGTVVGADGQSAYQIALSEGFNGTVRDWLDSLASKNQTDLSINRCLFSSVVVWNVMQETSDGVSGSTGSGVIYKLDKENGTMYIITNYHVAYNSDTKKIGTDLRVGIFGKVYKDALMSAEYIGGSMTFDIAVLKVTSPIISQSNCMVAEIGNSDAVAVGAQAFVIGNSSGDGISATTGIISVDSEYIDMTGADDVTPVTFRVMRTDAAVNPGNSGGGLFTADGKLIGIVNAKTISSDVEATGYAIPTSIAVRVAENILYNCEGKYNTKVRKYLVGIQVSARESDAYYDTDTGYAYIVEKVYVAADVSAGALAYGKFQKDDLIVSMQINDGQIIQVTRMYKMIDAMLDARPGDLLTYVVMRNGEQVTLTIRLPSELAPTVE